MSDYEDLDTAFAGKLPMLMYMAIIWDFCDIDDPRSPEEKYAYYDIAKIYKHWLGHRNMYSAWTYGKIKARIYNSQELMLKRHR